MYAYWMLDFDVRVTSYELFAVAPVIAEAPYSAVAGASTARLSLAAPAAWFSVGSRPSNAVRPAAPLAYALLSVKYVSCAVAAVRASDFALESYALPFWFRKAGMAIAARMPMIRIT